MKEKILTLSVIIFISICGICMAFSKYYENRDFEQYSVALKDYKAKEYKSAYRSFGKVTLFSSIKTPALFRQARSAELLGDYKGAKKNYSLLLFLYPQSELYAVTEYNLAMLLYNMEDSSAKKHFKNIIKYYPNTDYALASEYYLASLDLKSAEKTKSYKKRSKLKHNAITRFVRYVEIAPDGRFAQNSIDKIIKSGIVTSCEDNLIIADSYYKRGLYQKASEYYSHTLIKNSWAKYAKNEFKKGSIQYGKLLTEKGLQNYSYFVEHQDMYDAIDEYVKTSDTPLNTVNYLANKYPNSKGADYFLFLKAQNTNNDSKYKIYAELFDRYPNSDFSAEALYNTFLDNIFKKQYDKAILLGQKHIAHFKTSDTSASVLFWMGKIYEKKHNYPLARSYYKRVISKYPDSYYSYRAYSKLNNGQELFIDKTVKLKPVIFPCEDKKEREMATKLIELGDYDFIEELYKNNKFVESWTAYKQGKIVHSVILAQDAMKKLNPKPKFNDVRWRLVYPLNYYSYVDKYKGEQDPLMIMSIMREESHFNHEIVSPAGAIGLMQLMPPTANEIASTYGLGVCLTNPKNNIQLGSLYYSKMKKSLWNKDAYAIMAYNGGWFSVVNWTKRLNYDDLDEFIEKIPYPETQMYVKKVLRSFWNYSNIYS